MEEVIKNPCKGTCKYTKDICIGCYRSKQEIVAWINLTIPEKKEILKLIAERKTNFK